VNIENAKKINIVKTRADLGLFSRGLVQSRSQALNLIKLGKVRINGALAIKPSALISADDKISIDSDEKYVSRAGFKLASVANYFEINFTDKTILDVGSSTGGFTDYAVKNGAKLVYAVDVGTNQLHKSLRNNPKILSYEKTDIRNFVIDKDKLPDIILMDVSFISSRLILPYLCERLSKSNTIFVIMVKPQFEIQSNLGLRNGVIKNDKIRRQVFKDFELWSKKYFKIVKKKDSEVAGEKGNRERFYLLNKIQIKH